MAADTSSSIFATWTLAAPCCTILFNSDIWRFFYPSNYSSPYILDVFWYCYCGVLGSKLVFSLAFTVAAWKTEVHRSWLDNIILSALEISGNLDDINMGRLASLRRSEAWDYAHGSSVRQKVLKINIYYDKIDKVFVAVQYMKWHYNGVIVLELSV